ncbi:hypothetical protein C3488_35825 [Streptomyces sp. Ru72]|nr:hypothetical protein C3488_35825 [Streptomyces sp. Ru72]
MRSLKRFRSRARPVLHGKAEDLALAQATSGRHVHEGLVALRQLRANRLDPLGWPGFDLARLQTRCPH